MLAAVDVERSGRGMTPEDKLKHYVRTTMLFLEDEDSVSAERFLVKVRFLCVRSIHDWNEARLLWECERAQA